MNNNKPLQIFEHQTLKLGSDERFKMQHFKALERYAYKNNEKYFSVGNKRIKFSNYVGVIQVKKLTIEVLPKADNLGSNTSSKDKWHNALIDMLHECKLIKINSISNANLKLKSSSILDLYFDLFLTETERLFKQGLRNDYRRIKSNLNKVKGKIIFTEHLKKNAFHKERFFVEHQVFDPNNRLNQILYKAIKILSDLSNNSKHVVRIKRLLLNFENITEENITKSWFDKITFNRNTERYRQAITLAKLIILKYSPDLKGGNENVLAIMFDMNVLFENYVYRKLKVIQNDENIPILNVREQNRTPFWESRGLRADIVLETENQNIVIDTKWKVLRANKPSDGDLKQMFVYNLHYDAQTSILLYPKTIFDTSDKKPFRHHLFEDKYCQIAFANLFNDKGKLDSKLGYRIYFDLLEKEIIEYSSS